QSQSWAGPLRQRRRRRRASHRGRDAAAEDRRRPRARSLSRRWTGSERRGGWTDRDGVARTRERRVAEGGALRVLAQTGPRRHPMFADVPTTTELGMADVRMDTWFGLLAPPHTPEPIVARLVRESDAVVNQPAFREKLFRIGCDAAWMPPTEFGIFMRDDAKKWEKLIPAMGVPMVD